MIAVITLYRLHNLSYYLLRYYIVNISHAHFIIMYPNNDTILKQYTSACHRQKTASHVVTTGGVCLIDRPRRCGCLIRRRKSKRRNCRGNEVHQPGQFRVIAFRDQCMIIITAGRTLRGSVAIKIQFEKHIIRR